MNAQRRAALAIALAAGSLLAVPAAHAGPGIVDEQVDGNVLEARIHILGVDYADLRIEFEEVEGLEPGALGLSAELLDVWDLLALTLRLPDQLLTSIPGDLPVLLSVDPQPGLSFRGAVRVTLTTELLPYVPGTRLRLFHAPLLGPFEDVTADTSAGSYRVGSMRPDFNTSSFVVATDLRSDQTVSERKLDRLDGLLDTYAGDVHPGVRAVLEAHATAVRAAFEAGQPQAAIASLDGFTTAVLAASGEGVPDRWEAQGGDDNVAGELRSQAATLRYSLLQLGGG